MEVLNNKRLKIFALSLTLGLMIGFSYSAVGEDKEETKKTEVKADASKDKKQPDAKKDSSGDKKEEKRDGRRKLGAPKKINQPEHEGLTSDQLKAPIPRKIKGYQSVNYDKLTEFEYILKNLDELEAADEAAKGEKGEPAKKEDKPSKDKSDKPAKANKDDKKPADKKDKDEKPKSDGAPSGFEKSDEVPEGFIPREDKVYDFNDPKVRAAARSGDKQIPKAIRKLHKKKVAIAGYMIPIDFRKGGTNEFILVKIVPSCFFCQQPLPNEWIDVKVKDGKRVPYEGDNPITVAGVIEVGANYEEDVFLNLYRMEAHKVEIHPVE